MGSDKFSPSSSGSSGFPKGTGVGGNGALKSKFVETASSAKGITECNKALEANSAAINATEKSILLLKEQLQNYTNSMMKSGSENANAFDAENEIAEYKEQIESAEKKREQLQETRKDLIKKLKKYKDRARQEKQQQEKLRQQNEAKKKNNGNHQNCYQCHRFFLIQKRIRVHRIQAVEMHYGNNQHYCQKNRIV